MNLQKVNIDLEIGKKIKELRLIRGMSQSDLGRKVGITFQQIQKYEKGTNRVLVSRLCDLAEALSVDIVYFFTVVPESNTEELSEGSTMFNYTNDGSDADSKEMLGLVREYQKIKNKRLRNAIYSLIRSLSASQEQ
jgi:transcriptional regulator with XRE-family HTH domain